MIRLSLDGSEDHENSISIPGQELDTTWYTVIVQLVKDPIIPENQVAIDLAKEGFWSNETQICF